MERFSKRYTQWVIEKARELKSDGCTVVSEIYRWCCLEHDLGYRWGFDPRVFWRYGMKRPITRREVDRRFRECIQSKSPLKNYSPVSWIRWVGVRLFGAFTDHKFGKAK